MKKLAGLALAVLLAPLSWAAPAVNAQTIAIADKHIDPRQAREVHIVFPAGDLNVETTDGDAIRFRVTARCEDHWDNCRERADRISAVSQYTGDAVWLRLEGVRKFPPGGPKLTVQVEVPRGLAVGVEMSAGDLTVHGIERDVSVDMSAGDVNIDLPERRVQSVDVHVSVGDATLRSRDHVLEGDGWLGKRIDWNEGRGQSRVRVKLGAGDVNVLLR